MMVGVGRFLYFLKKSMLRRPAEGTGVLSSSLATACEIVLKNEDLISRGYGKVGEADDAFGVS